MMTTRGGGRRRDGGSRPSRAHGEHTRKGGERWFTLNACAPVGVCAGTVDGIIFFRKRSLHFFFSR